MRIVITGQTYYPGNNGQAIFTIHLAEGLARAGHEVAVLVPGYGPCYRTDFINGVFVHEVQTAKLPWLHPEARFTLFPQPLIRRILKQFQPDIIHIQDHYFLSKDVTNIAHQMNIPVVGTNHFLPENVLPYLKLLPIPGPVIISIMWRLMLWTYNRLRIVSTPTETAARILRAQQIRVPVVPISCGVDKRHFRPRPDLDREKACQILNLPSDKILFLYVGRLDHEKRIDLLLRGLALQAGSQPVEDVHLLIAGQGTATGDLRALARTLGLEDRVHFLGYVSTEVLPLLYQTAHVFAMPSPQELQSIASLEAMASGRPLLAANARALPELVKHRVNGYLFEPDVPEQVAEGIDFLLRNRHQWERMGRASRAIAEAHSLENTIRRYIAFYEETLGLSSGSMEDPVEVFLDSVESS